MTTTTPPARDWRCRPRQGSARATNPIETTLSNLEASGGAQGGVFIANTGNVIIGGVNAVNGVSANGDDMIAYIKLAVSPSGEHHRHRRMGTK